MTEREQLLAMYQRAGVTYAEADELNPADRVNDATTCITVTRDDHSCTAIGGYYMFCCEHYFDQDGNLLHVAIWE